MTAKYEPCPRPVSLAVCDSAAWCVLSGNCGCDHKFKRLLRRRSGATGEIRGYSAGGPMPVRCEICEWRGRRITPRSAPCPSCGSRVEFA